MKTQSQIKLVKTGYVITLLAVFLFSLKDVEHSFREGYNYTENGRIPGFLEGLAMLVILFLGLRVLVYLYRFIDSIQVGNVFSEDNVKRLNRMGWYCTIMPFLLFAFDAAVFLQRNIISKNGVYKIIEKVDFQIWLLIFGLTLLTIAFVFKKGIEIKQENDLTV